jgi:hypothetical protein
VGRDEGRPGGAGAAGVGNGGRAARVGSEDLGGIGRVAAARSVIDGLGHAARGESQHLPGRPARGAGRGGEVLAGGAVAAQHLAMGEIAEVVAGMAAARGERERARHHRLRAERLSW